MFTVNCSIRNTAGLEYPSFIGLLSPTHERLNEDSGGLLGVCEQRVNQSVWRMLSFKSGCHFVFLFKPLSTGI